jgi:hypothetical protein
VSESAPPRRRLSRRRKLLFALVPLTALLVVAEFAARSFRAGRSHAPFGGGSYRDQRIDLIRRGFPAAHDPELGYIPRPGFASADNRWGAMVTIDAQGLRSNGPQPRPAGERGVLAVGDSFTFGDQVADADTWPAGLERQLQRPVWNGGVFGYSFAQTVLRAEQLLERLPVDTLVVSLIPDDIKRCEQSKRFTEIPWFDLVNGALVPKNVPVPDTDRSPLDQQYVRKLMGHSALLDTLCWNAFPRWWVGDQREVWVHEPGTGRVICELLLARLQQRCQARSLRLLLVLQDYLRPGERATADALQFVASARASGVETLDLASRFGELVAQEPSLQQRWFAGHMTPAGNAWVAEQIAAVLRVPPARR